MIAEPPASLGARQRIAEAVLGPVDWESDAVGFRDCPGVDLHSTPSGRRDCRVMIDGAPTLYCVHASCRAVVEDTNRRLRSEMGRAEARRDRGWCPRICSPEDIERQRQKDDKQRLAELARQKLPRLLAKFAILPTDLWHESPTSLVGVADFDLWRWFLRIFDPADIVWIGETKDSGSERHATHFRPVSEWLEQGQHPGTRVAPATFKPGSFSRSKDAVAAHRLFVVESDTLTIRQQCAVIQFVRRFFELRAIVYSGNKSLHAYFDRVPGEALSELETILPNLGVDPAGFRPAQPFRLPGVFHAETNRGVDLLYLDANARHE